MLEVKVNLVPFGKRDLEREIGVIKIWNKGTGTERIGNYGYEIVSERGQVVQGDLDGFDRSEGALVLIKEILSEAL